MIVINELEIVDGGVSTVQFLLSYRADYYFVIAANVPIKQGWRGIRDTFGVGWGGE